MTGRTQQEAPAGPAAAEPLPAGWEWAERTEAVAAPQADREALITELHRYGRDIEELDEDERDAATDAARLVASGIPEPFRRGVFEHQRKDGSVTRLVNYECERARCHYAALDRRHIWMHAAGHLARGE